MFISTMQEEMSRLNRVVHGDDVPQNAKGLVNQAFDRASYAFNGNSETAFWAAVADCYNRLNAQRILSILSDGNAKAGVAAEKARIQNAWNEFMERAPFDDGGGHHPSNIVEAAELLEMAYNETMEAKTSKQFCPCALGFWASLNSIRQTEGLPKLK